MSLRYSDEVLALIPARSGSKSIPDKNIRSVGGKPLLAWSIQHAQQAECVDRVIVSTDSTLYAEIAKSYGAEVPFIRPAHLAGDSVRDQPVFEHALRWILEAEGRVPSVCVHLRPTSPLRDPSAIDAMVRLLLEHPDADSVRSVTPAPHTPYKMWRVRNDGYLEPLLSLTGVDEPYNSPRQALPEVLLQTASVDVVRSAVVLERGSMSGTTILPYLEPNLLDIDSIGELETAGHLLNVMSRPFGTPEVLCFDIDGVLATLVEGNHYQDAKPIPEMIRRVNLAFDAGHHVILFTARGSATGMDWRSITERQLAEWGVKYHELRFGKPAASFYIDDRMMRTSELDLLLSRCSPRTSEKLATARGAE